MWKVRNKTSKGTGKEGGEAKEQTLNHREHTEATRGEVGGAGKQVRGAGCTFRVESQVRYGGAGSLPHIPATDLMPYVNYTSIKIKIQKPQEATTKALMRASRESREAPWRQAAHAAQSEAEVWCRCVPGGPPSEPARLEMSVAGFLGRENGGGSLRVSCQRLAPSKVTQDDSHHRT